LQEKFGKGNSEVELPIADRNPVPVSLENEGKSLLFGCQKKEQ